MLFMPLLFADAMRCRFRLYSLFILLRDVTCASIISLCFDAILLSFSPFLIIFLPFFILLPLSDITFQPFSRLPPMLVFAAIFRLAFSRHYYYAISLPVILLTLPLLRLRRDAARCCCR